METMPATSANPFDPSQPEPPLAGRDALFARVHQHLTGAPVTRALLIVGRRRSGRTTVLRALRTRFDDSFVWADLGFKPSALTSEAAFWQVLWEAAKDAAAARGLSVHRLPPWPDDKPLGALRTWLASRALPEFYQLIRPHRRLVWVLDNAEPLADAVTRGDLPADLGAAVAALLGPQLGLLLTAHLDAETHLYSALSPVVAPDDTVRLSALSLDDVRTLLAYGRDGAEPEFDRVLYQAAGGAPELTLRAAALVHDYSRGEYYQAAHLHAVTPDLLLWARPGFGLMWENLTGDEQAVLTALAHLRFDHPEKPVQAEHIELWLADTEYPLDLTAIFSVLRRLDFIEVVQHAHHDVRARAGLFEQWIRETVRRDHLRRVLPPASAPLIDPRVARYGLIGLGTLVTVLLLALLLGTPSDDLPPQEPIPTVVLTPASGD
jgi:hypothetical protein